MGLIDRALEISPERLAAGGSRADKYVGGKNAVKVGGIAIALGIIADGAGKQWGASLALAGTLVEGGGGYVMAGVSDQLRLESKSDSPNIG